MSRFTTNHSEYTSLSTANNYVCVVVFFNMAPTKKCDMLRQLDCEDLTENKGFKNVKVSLFEWYYCRVLLT